MLPCNLTHLAKDSTEKPHPLTTPPSYQTSFSKTAQLKKIHKKARTDPFAHACRCTNLPESPKSEEIPAGIFKISVVLVAVIGGIEGAAAVQHAADHAHHGNQDHDNRDQNADNGADQTAGGQAGVAGSAVGVVLGFLAGHAGKDDAQNAEQNAGTGAGIKTPSKSRNIILE